ncbi:MAG: hypothetical protein AVDCRST_MAG20-196, partial [uncultured Acidimicrobiales bacterium]
ERRALHPCAVARPRAGSRDGDRARPGAPWPAGGAGARPRRCARGRDRRRPVGRLRHRPRARQLPALGHPHRGRRPDLPRHGDGGRPVRLPGAPRPDHRCRPGGQGHGVGPPPRPRAHAHRGPPRPAVLGDPLRVGLARLPDAEAGPAHPHHASAQRAGGHPAPVRRYQGV